jgi:hypothetical protein
VKAPANTPEPIITGHEARAFFVGPDGDLDGRFGAMPWSFSVRTTSSTASTP